MSVIKTFTSQRYDDNRRVSICADTNGAMLGIDAAGMTVYFHLDLDDLGTLQTAITNVLRQLRETETAEKEAA